MENDYLKELKISQNISNFNADHTSPSPSVGSYQFLVLVLGIPFCLLTVLGNILVIYAWAVTPTLRTPPNILIVSLAIVDLLVGLTSVPLGFIYIYHGRWLFGHNVALCQFSLLCDYGLMCLSANHLVLIALDRYRILGEGVGYITRNTSAAPFLESIVILWAISLWMVSPIVLDWEGMALDPQLEHHCVIKKTAFWSMLTNLTDIILPSYLLGRIYFCIFTKLGKRWEKQMTMVVRKGSGAHPEVDTAIIASSVEVLKVIENHAGAVIESRMDRKTNLTLGILIGAFYVCWSPYAVASLIGMVTDHVLPSSLFYYLALFGMTNSACNPFIYAVRVPDFRSAFRHIFKRGEIV